MSLFYPDANGGAINLYDLYGRCYYDEKEAFDLVGFINVGGKVRGYKKYATAMDLTPWIFDGEGQRPTNSDLLELSTFAPPCIYGKPLVEYLNRNDFRHALKIPDDVQAWEICNTSITSGYDR